VWRDECFVSLQAGHTWEDMNERLLRNMQIITLITYNNNYKTYIAPISSKKRTELCGAPSTGVGQTHSPVTEE